MKYPLRVENIQTHETNAIKHSVWGVYATKKKLSQWSENDYGHSPILSRMPEIKGIIDLYIARRFAIHSSMY